MGSTYPQSLDNVAEGWLASLLLFTAVQPSASFRRGDHGTVELISAVPVPTMNGVLTVRPEPDPEEVARFAAAPKPEALPWSIQIRGDRFDDRIVDTAAEHGLKEHTTLPFMLKTLTDADPSLPDAEATVRRLSSTDSALYQRSPAAGFEAPAETFTRLVSSAVMDHPAMRSFVVEAEGSPVATAFAILIGELVGVYNISVPEQHRRRGYGRLATAAVLRDAYAAGARTAFLHGSPMAVPLYEGMGFRTVDDWTVFHA